MRIPTPPSGGNSREQRERYRRRGHPCPRSRTPSDRCCPGAAAREDDPNPCRGAGRPRPESESPPEARRAIFSSPKALPTKSPEPRSSTALFHLPKDFLGRGDLLVVLLVRHEPQGLLAAEDQHPEHHETVIEQTVHFRLQRLVEIDKDVTAQYRVEFTERAIRHQIVLRKNDVLRQRLVEERSPVLCGVVLGERSLAARANVVVGVLLHPLQRKDPSFRALQHHLIDIRRVNP